MILFGFSRYILAWCRLVRIFNVPVVLSAMLVGALIVSDQLSGSVCAMLCLGALLGTAAVQSYNDYEDREEDKINAPFRPIPSGAFSAEFVLWNGHVCAILHCLLSGYLFSWAAGSVMATSYLLTRWYSYLKKRTLVHHVLLPLALGLLPIYGAFIAAAKPTEISSAKWSVLISCATSIVLVDINMNIIGTFKDLFSGSAEECVLPVVFGRRPSILVALITGLAGIVVQTVPVYQHMCSWYPIIPLMAGLVFHLYSRTYLFQFPSAEVGYSALKAGRVTECCVFPAMMFGFRSPIQAAGIVSLLVISAASAQAWIQEANLTNDEVENVDPLTHNESSSASGHPASLQEVTVPKPRRAECITITTCLIFTTVAYLMGDPEDGGIWTRLFIPLMSCALGGLGVLFTTREVAVAGLVQNFEWYTVRYLVVVCILILVDEAIHYLFAGKLSWISFQLGCSCGEC